MKIKIIPQKKRDLSLAIRDVATSRNIPFNEAYTLIRNFCLERKLPYTSKSIKFAVAHTLTKGGNNVPRS